MSAQAGCFREVTAQSCVGSVERCSRGILHIVLGPFTRKLSREQYQALLSTPLEGQSHLDEQAEPQQSAFALATLLSRHTPAGQS